MGWVAEEGEEREEEREQEEQEEQGEQEEKAVVAAAEEEPQQEKQQEGQEEEQAEEEEEEQEQEQEGCGTVSVKKKASVHSRRKGGGGGRSRRRRHWRLCYHRRRSWRGLLRQWWWRRWRHAGQIRHLELDDQRHQLRPRVVLQTEPGGVSETAPPSGAEEWIGSAPRPQRPRAVPLWHSPPSPSETPPQLAMSSLEKREACQGNAETHGELWVLTARISFIESAPSSASSPATHLALSAAAAAKARPPRKFEHRRHLPRAQSMWRWGGGRTVSSTAHFAQRLPLRRAAA